MANRPFAGSASTPAGLPAHDLAALHHDAVSRTLAVMGQPRLAAQQALRMARTVRVDDHAAPSSLSRLPRQALFDTLPAELVRPWAQEKGLSTKKSTSTTTSGTPLHPATATETNSLQEGTYATLDIVLPEYHRQQNPHCQGCAVPLVLGINATFGTATTSKARGLVCLACHTVSLAQLPDSESKRRLRSRRVRLSEKRNVSSLERPTKWSKLVEQGPSTSSSQAVGISQAAERAAPSEDNSSGKTTVLNSIIDQPKPPSTTLDGRMREKKRTKRKEEVLAPTTPTIATTSNLDTTSSKPAKEPVIVAGQAANLLGSNSRVSRPAERADKPRSTVRDDKVKDDRSALRAMLAANKKKKQDQSSQRGGSSQNTSTSGSGLQSFLDSL